MYSVNSRSMIDLLWKTEWITKISVISFATILDEVIISELLFVRIDTILLFQL